MGDIPCIPGLFVAGVFSGALSTVSSGLNALANVTFQDFIQGGCGVQMAEKKKNLVSKALAVGYGIIAYAVVFLVKYLPGVLEVNQKRNHNMIIKGPKQQFSYNYLSSFSIFNCSLGCPRNIRNRWRSSIRNVYFRNVHSLGQLHCKHQYNNHKLLYFQSFTFPLLLDYM